MFDVKRGDLVEFTDTPQREYTVGDEKLARYGVAVAPETSRGVRIVDRYGRVRTVPGDCIVAYAWAGWIPDGLEAIVAQFEAHDAAADCADDYF